MDGLQLALLSLGVINTALLLAIVLINLNSYLKMRAQYTLFIVIFAALFLVQYLVSAVHFFGSMEIYNYGMGAHLLVITGIQTVGFAYFLWMQQQ